MLRLRAMNDEIRARSDAFSAAPIDHYVLMCECPSEECTEMLTVSRGVVELARSDDSWFLVTPRHVTPTGRLVKSAAGACIVVADPA